MEKMEKQSFLERGCRLRASVSLHADRQPCFVALLGVLTSILPLLLIPGLTFFDASLFALAGLGTCCVLLPLRTVCLKYACPLLLGFCSILFLRWENSQDTLAARFGETPCGAIVEMRIIDSSTASDALPWLPLPKNIVCELIRFRYSARDEWRNASGKIMLRYTGDAPFAPGYGDIVEGRGFLFATPPPLLDSAFDYRSYLERRGIRLTFTADTCRIVTNGTGFRRELLDLRDRLLAKLCSSFRSDSRKSLCAGILFGFKQGIAPETKREFIESGTIHILTVSGTHIGIFASILFLLLRFVPIRLRYLLVPFLTFFYVLSTGMQPPAFRAFTMLAVWSVTRAFLCTASALNSMMLAAFILLLWNPFNILEPGFQYSFLTVFALMLSADFIRFWLKPLNETWHWIHPDRITTLMYFRYTLIRWSLTVLLSCLMAWLVSCALCLLYQGIYASGSVFANMVLLPSAWLCFMASGLTALFCGIPGVVALGGLVMESILELMTLLASFFAENGSVLLPRAALWTVFLFPALLFVLLRSRRNVVMMCSIAGLCALLLFWNYRHAAMEPEILVIHGGSSSVPALVISAPRDGYGVIWNLPDFEACSVAISHLESQGIGTIRDLIASGVSRDFCGGMPYLAGRVTIDHLILPYKPPRNAASAEKILQLVREQGGTVHFFTEKKADFPAFKRWNLKTFAKKEFSGLELQGFDFTIKATFRDFGDGHCFLRIENMRSNTVLAELELTNSLNRKIYRYKINNGTDTE